MKEFALSPKERIALVEAKVADAEQMIAVAKVNCQFQFYNSAINRLYYACFHIASAALVSIGIDEVKRHEGVRNLFSLHFIKSGKIDLAWSHFYSYMFSCRSEADYDNFVKYNKEEVEELLPQVEDFVRIVKSQICMTSDL